MGTDAEHALALERFLRGERVLWDDVELQRLDGQVRVTIALDYPLQTSCLGEADDRIDDAEATWDDFVDRSPAASKARAGRDLLLVLAESLGAGAPEIYYRNGDYECWWAPGFPREQPPSRSEPLELPERTPRQRRDVGAGALAIGMLVASCAGTGALAYGLSHVFFPQLAVPAAIFAGVFGVQSMIGESLFETLVFFAVVAGSGVGIAHFAPLLVGAEAPSAAALLASATIGLGLGVLTGKTLQLIFEDS